SFGSRGDFTALDVSSGTLLLTQSDSIWRLGPAGIFTPSNPAPVVVTQQGFVLSAVEGHDTGFVSLVTFKDPAGLKSLSDYGATVYWGDGTALDTTTPVIVDNHNGTYSVQAHHTYKEESASDHAGSTPYQVVVTIRHNLALNTTANDTATVSDAAVVV